MTPSQNASSLRAMCSWCRDIPRDEGEQDVLDLGRIEGVLGYISS
jgi:hypothetical protein